MELKKKISTFVVVAALFLSALKLHAAVSPTLLTSGSDTTAASSYTTASVSPTAGNLVLLFVYNSHGDPAGAPSSITGTLSATWTQHTGTNIPRDFDTDANPTKIASVWRTSNTSGSGTITINYGDNQTAAIWFVVELSGVDTTTNNGVGAAASTFSDTVTTSGSVASVGSGSAFRIGFIVSNSNPAGTDHHAWSEAGWTELGEVEVANPDATASVGYNSSDTDLGTTVTFDQNDRYGSISLQITAAAGGRCVPGSLLLLGVGC